MKEISTDGNVQTVADLVPKAFPVFYVLAPDYMRLLLEPLMEYAATWPADFAFHDLGKRTAPPFSSVDFSLPFYSPFLLSLCLTAC